MRAYFLPAAIACALTCCLTTTGRADIVFSNPIDRLNPAQDNPYTDDQVVISGITVSGIGFGPGGIAGSNATNEYRLTGWSNAFNSGNYITWTLTPDSGNKLSLENLMYNSTVNANGPTMFALRSSLDGFTADIGAATGTGTTISLADAAFQNLMSSIEFRLFAWGANDGAGANSRQFGIDDFVFNGVVAVPEASSFLFGGLGCAFLGLAWNRRRKA
ncbi:MAG: hypothetical protein CMJ58_21935 [Planctomycetaceae bacterium]|nr:hypothetical protein [Planctomycetaceae bacterium]